MTPLAPSLVVTVNACTARAVQVQPKSRKTGKPISAFGWRVPEGESRDFRSPYDLHIHEIQPVGNEPSFPENKEETMTTTITVKANHGWPVKVTHTNPKTGEMIAPPVIVEAGKTQDFVATSTADLRIHEIQPDDMDCAAEQARVTKDAEVAVA